MQVDPVEQGSGYPAQVFLHMAIPAGALLIRVVKKTARTGVHRSHHHETGRILNGITRSGDIDDPVLEGLPQHFEHRPFKFGEFVEKEYAIMSEGYFPRFWNRSSSDQGDIADGMVGGAERAPGNQGGIGP